MNAKSFKVPSRLRFLVRPNAISDIRDRSSAMSATATPTLLNTSHTASGNTSASRLPSRMGITHRKSGPLADEQQVLTRTELEDVAVPIAEPRRGLDGGHVPGLLQAREQLLCATKNDHRLCLPYDTVPAGDHHDADRRAPGQDLGPDLVTHPVTISPHIRAASSRTTDTRQVGVSDPARRGPNRPRAGSLTPPHHTFSSFYVRPGRHRAPASLVSTSRKCSLL